MTEQERTKLMLAEALRVLNRLTGAAWAVTIAARVDGGVRSERCGTCGGSGDVPPWASTCQACMGSGELLVKL